MELYDVMRTTFAARDFTDEPVPDEVVARILDNARFAPSGGNRQGWRVIQVRDSAKRAALIPLIEPTLKRYRAQVEAGENPWNTVDASTVDEAAVEAVTVPPGFIERLTNAPVVLLVLVDLKVVASFDSELDRIGVISGASIYPFVWNILLSARNEGYGGTLTTFVAGKEPDVRALFGIPDQFAVCAMLPIGRPVKQFTKLRRNPVDAFAWVDTFEGDPIG
ncbi:MAG: nitroreductase family protein [Gammaproteobacteria bacterium]|nr:nitroreductase family protein [Gammaproteobacteria bacterium]